MTQVKTVDFRSAAAELVASAGSRYNCPMDPSEKKKALRCSACGGALALGYG